VTKRGGIAIKTSQPRQQTRDHLRDLLASELKLLLPNSLQPGSDLIERLLDAVQLYLSRIGELLDGFRCPLQMKVDLAQEFATALAHQKHAYAAEEHSQTAQAISDLFALLHPFRNPTFRVPLGILCTGL